MSALENIQKQLQASKRSFSNLTGSIITRTKSVANSAMQSPVSPTSLLRKATPSINRANKTLSPIAEGLGSTALDFSVRPFTRLVARATVSATGQKEYVPGKKTRPLSGAAEELLIGKDRITSFKEGNRVLTKDLEKYISPGKAKIAAPLLIGAGTLMDAVPFGVDDFLKQGGKKVGKESIESLVSKGGDDAIKRFLDTKLAKDVAKGDKVTRLKNTAHSLYTQIVDEIHPAEMLEKQAQKVSGVVKPIEDSITYKFKRYLGSGGMAHLRHERELKPILAQLGDLPKDEFDGFLIAKRELGLEQAGRKAKGVDPDEAQRYMTGIRDKYGDDIFNEMQEIAEKLYAYQDASLRKLVDGGFISEEAYSAIKQSNFDYAPLKRVMDKVDEALGTGSLQAGSTPDMLKKFEGSERKILSPLESIIADTYKIEALVAKNDFAKSIADLKDLLPEGTIKVLRGADNVTKRRELLTALKENKLSRNETRRLLRTQKVRLRVLRKELGQIHSVALRAEQRLDKMSVIPKSTTKLKSVRFQGDELIGGKVVTDKTREFAYGAIKQIVKEKDSKKFLYKLMSLPAEDLKYLLNKAGTKTDKVDEIMNEIDSLRKSLSDKEINRQVLRKGLNRVRDTPTFDKHTMTVWRNGVKEIYEVPKDIEVMIKGLDKESANTLIKIASSAAGVFRQGQTGRNIDFMIPNYVKDQFDAAIGSKHGYIPFIDSIRGMVHLFNYDFRGGDKLVEDWMRAGGDLALSKAAGREIGSDVMGAAEKQSILRKLFDWYSGKLDFIGRYSEKSTRLGVADRAYRKTGNMAEAVMDSREATVDFARMGSKMRTLNSVIPFLNPQVQGFDKLLRTAKNNPKKFALTMTAYGTFPAATISLYNNAYFGEEYSKVPDWEKDSNFIIMTGSSRQGRPTYIKIPKGNIIPLVANPTDHFITYLFKNDQQSFKSLLASMISSALPVIGDGSNPEEIASRTLGNVIPHVVKPSTEAMANYDFFKAGPIESAGMQFKDEGDRKREGTPDVYGAIGSVVGLSPLKVEKVLEGHLASFAKTPADVLEIIDDVKNGKPIDANSVPILRRFFGDYVEFADYDGPKTVKNFKVKQLKPKLKLTPSNRL